MGTELFSVFSEEERKMAKKLCALCQQEYASDMRFGVMLCQTCIDGYSKAMGGDADAVAHFSNPKNFPNATELAQKNVIGRIVKKTQQIAASQQGKQQQQEQKREAYQVQKNSTQHKEKETPYVGNNEKPEKIFLFKLICGQNEFPFYFDTERPFKYAGTLATEMSYTYSGTYHPESYTYTGATVGGIHTGGWQKNEAHVQQHQTYSGKGNLTYNDKFVDSVVLASHLIPFAKEMGVPVSVAGIIKLRSDFTQYDFNTVMSNLGTDAYSQINRANASADKAPSMSTCNKVLKFLKKALDGDFTPEAAESKEKRNSKRTKSLELFAAIAAIVIALIAGISSLVTYNNNAPYREIAVALESNTFSEEWVSSNHYRYVIDTKKGMNEVAKHLAILRNNEDVERTLYILSELLSIGVEIEGEYYYASSDYIDWIKNYAMKNGKKLSSDKGSYVYNLYGHTLEWDPNMMMNQFYLDGDIVTVDNWYYKIPESEKVCIS